jgi:hypothetical protein
MIRNLSVLVLPTSAAISDQVLAKILLEKAILSERKSVRGVETYGLISLGAASTTVFLKAVESPIK